MSSFAVRFVLFVFAGAVVGLLAGLLLGLLDVVENPFWLMSAGIAAGAAWIVWAQVSKDV